MQSENLNKLFEALAAAQGEMKAAKMDAQNYYGGSYATLNSLQEATRPVLAKHGIAITQIIQGNIDNGLVLQTWLGHSSGQFIMSEWPIAQQKDIQKFGSALTYVKRYAWSAVCGIAGDDDDDGEAAVDRQQKKQPVQKKQPQPQNGNGKQRVNNPQALLETVNNRVLVPYDNVSHLFNAIRQESTLEDYAWPGPDDSEGWKAAYEMAKNHAEAKTKAETT